MGIFYYEFWDQSFYRYISTKDCFPFCRMPLNSVVAFDAQKCFAFVQFCSSVLWIISWIMLEEIMFVPKIITCYDACFSLVITESQLFHSLWSILNFVQGRWWAWSFILLRLDIQLSSNKVEEAVLFSNICFCHFCQKSDELPLCINSRSFIRLNVKCGVFCVFVFYVCVCMFVSVHVCAPVSCYFPILVEICCVSPLKKCCLWVCII